MSKWAFLAMSGCAVGVAVAQQAPEPTLPAEQVPPPLEVEVEDRFSLDLSLRYTSDYFFRGIVQRSDAFNLQPSIEVGYGLIPREEWSLNVFGGLWSHFTDDTVEDENGGFDERWYELDAYLGLTLDFADRWSLTGVYTWYQSPASNFEDVEDVTVSLAFDDTGLWGDEGWEGFGIFPYVLFAIETEDAADGGDEGVYFEFGLAPAVALYEGDAGGLTLAFPIAAGFSVSDYYEDAEEDDDSFGFATFGAQLAFALPEGSIGQWTFTTGVDYLLLGDHTEEYNGGDDDEWIAYVEAAWSF